MRGGRHPSLRAAGSKTAVRGVAVRGVAVMVGVADECQGGRSVTACLVEAERMAAWLAGEPWLGRERRGEYVSTYIYVYVHGNMQGQFSV